MLYLAWDREINISLFFCDVFVWKWGPRPRTSSRCYHGNKSAAIFKKGIFVHPPRVPSCMQNLKGGWKFLFHKMFDSYRDSFLIPLQYIEWIEWIKIYYKIIQMVRALWLAIKPFYMSVCKHGFRSSFISYFIKEM